MNQILYKCFLENNKTKKSNKFLIVFIISVILIAFAIIFYIFIKRKININENVSRKIVYNYKIMTLYSDSNEQYNSKKLLQGNESEPFVIGLIQIEKINLTYPILSTTNDQLLKIAPCRFSRSNAK